jgi:uncharacterized membrane protein YdjX (TVP38/TMEM64 family)
MTEKSKKIIILTAAALFLLLFMASAWLLGRPMLEFVSEPERFRAWVSENALLGKAAFVGMMAMQVFVAIIPGEPLEIVAGYAFGAVEGTLLCLAGATIGSILVFLFVRKFGVRAVELFFPKEKIENLKFLQDSRRLNLMVFLIFFIPGTPKDVLCYCVGLTKMKLPTWVLITATARIPSVITSTIGGDALGLGAHGFAAAVFAATLALSAVGLLIYKKICRTKGLKP